MRNEVIELRDKFTAEEKHALLIELGYQYKISQSIKTAGNFSGKVQEIISFPVYYKMEEKTGRYGETFQIITNVLTLANPIDTKVDYWLYNGLPEVNFSKEEAEYVFENILLPKTNYNVKTDWEDFSPVGL